MLSALLHPRSTPPRRSRPGRQDRSPFSSPYTVIENSPLAARNERMRARRRASGEFEEGRGLLSGQHGDSHSGSGREDNDEEDGSDDDGRGGEDVQEDDGEANENEDEDEDEDGLGEHTPLLPIFSAAHLDSLPVYNLTHAIRLVIVPRCETTLTWDQLRSPQVSQFLVKPIQQQIRTQHFSRATIYALMANCLQFSKEIQEDPGNSGTSKTRVMVCELLAIKLLKDYSTRELIDALSYDFDPLQGQTFTNPTTVVSSNWEPLKNKNPARATRVSTLEVAIRAQAKHLLAHPLVVRQLEAIWAGTIVFHSAADNLHRPQRIRIPNQNRGYGTTAGRNVPILQASPDKLQPPKQRDHIEAVPVVVRRSVTLYDPRDASLLKLSRLRVPRYRQFLSTCSLAILLCLYVAVLVQRSLKISGLEVVFWFWSLGFMLDEIVGFNEQGFSLYIMSIWNTFDLGILLLLMVYYCMRLYGLLIPDTGQGHIASMAYDVLAATAVLLFPRLFSVLDHYRYFSQLLIAFRLMAVDLIAVFILIIIACSGFFVAFTLSFGADEYNPRGVMYGLFQMLLGFTPAAWNIWDNYNMLGKAILTLFLFICHFLIVTILITVLTNSFMAIVANANEEHQFVFAVNAISMVKSDALFSYIAPTNFFAWFLTPLRYLVPFRKYVKINRTVIKVTHFPILFAIYFYERVFLQTAAFESTDLVEQRGRKEARRELLANGKNGFNLFSPTAKLRNGSIASFRKDKALDDVFRRPYRNVSRPGMRPNTRKNTHQVSTWIQGMGPDGKASPPVEQDQSVLDRLEARRLRLRRSQILRSRGMGSDRRDITDTTKSVASDPEDFMSSVAERRQRRAMNSSDLQNMSLDYAIQETDADGDIEGEDAVSSPGPSASRTRGPRRSHPQEDYFNSTMDVARQIDTVINSASALYPQQDQSKVPTKDPTPRSHPTRDPHHTRNVSISTILFNPLSPPTKSASPPKSSPASKKTPTPATTSGAVTPRVRRRSPLRPNPVLPTNPETTTAIATALPPATTLARPILQSRSAFQSAPDLSHLVRKHTHRNRRRKHRRSSLTTSSSSHSSSDDNDDPTYPSFHARKTVPPELAAMPSSFATQMAFATGALRRYHPRGAPAAAVVVRSADDGIGGESPAAEDARMMSRLMLARMRALEEGFRDVVGEVRALRSREGRGVGRRGERRGSAKESGDEIREKVDSENDEGDMKKDDDLDGKGKGKGKSI